MHDEGRATMTVDSVLASLRALCARVTGAEGEVPLRLVAPVYERLLQPREEADDYEAYIVREIHRVRSVLMKAPDLFDTARTLDECVEACLEDVGDVGRLPALAAVRLLLALAGGSDGNTFLLKDPTRVSEKDAGTRRRVGELLSSTDPAQTVQSHQVLLTRRCIPLESSRALNYVDFASLAPQSDRQATMWYPMSGRPCDENTFVNKSSSDENLLLPLKLSHNNVPKLIDVPVDPTERTERKPLQPISSTTRRNPPTPTDCDVLFFDGSQLIRRRASECGSTEASSGDDEVRSLSLWSSLVSNVTVPSSWEDIGKQNGPECPQKSTVPILQALTTLNAVDGVEIDESDLIEHSVKALCGIESVLFRRDISTAALRLPRLKHVRSKTASNSSLMAAIEDLRRAGTAFLRLEYLSVYFTQDVHRAGSTGHALGESLQLYLSSYQTRVHTHLSHSPHGSQMTLLKLISQTRHLRMQVVDLVEALDCGENESHSFWDLLSGGKLPKGVALLNRIHRALITWEFQDADGCMTALLTWLLIRTASPFVSVLGYFVSRGKVPSDIDPHNEFRLSFESVDASGDWSPKVSSKSNQDAFLPEFMIEALPTIQEIGQLESLLHGVVPEGYLFPPNQLKMTQRTQDAIDSLARIRNLLAEMSDRVDNVCCEDVHSMSCRRRSKSPRSDEHNDCQAGIKRIRRDAEQCDPSSGQARIVEQNEDITRGDSASLVGKPQSQNTSYDDSDRMDVSSVTAFEADHRYLRWRRDRAVRMPQAKSDLMGIYEETDQVPPEHANGAADTDLTASRDDSPVSFPSKSVHLSACSTHTPWPNHEDEQLPTECPHPTDRATDRGLLWRPRVRIHHAPGGSGGDAYVALYSQTSSVTEVKGQQRRFDSDRMSQASGGSGWAAFSSIYGHQPVHCQTDENSGVALHEQSKTYREDVIVESDSPGNGEADIEMSEEELTNEIVLDKDDITMEQTLPAPFDCGAQLPQASEDLDGQANDSIEYDSKRSEEYFSSVSTLLQLSTTFFAESMNAEDIALLESVQSRNTINVVLPEFRSIVQLAILEPIALIHRYLNRSALKALVTKLKLKTHLSWMQRVALMGEGLCMTTFASDIHANMETEARVLLALPGRLTMMLGLALIEAQVVSSTSSLPPFEYDVTNDFVRVTSRSRTPSISRVVNQLSLKYSHPSTLSMFMTPHVEDDYLHAHQFLLSLRVTEQELKDTWLTWRKSPIRQLTQDMNTRRLCDLLLFTSHGFLSAFHEAFTCCILMNRWHQLQRDIDSVELVSQLQFLHEQFTSDARACCFQKSEQKEALATVQNLLDSVWDFGNVLRQVRLQRISLDSAAAIVPAIANRQAATFQELLNFLRRQEITEKGIVRAFTKHLILRLDTNTATHGA